MDISVAYNRYKFLGDEFLTWLWFVMEKDRDQLTDPGKEPITIEIGNRIVLENRLNDAVETITIKGDDAGLEEGILALKKGAFVTELNLVYRSGDQEWKFTLKGESLSFASLKVPETGPIESGDEIEAMVIDKAFLYDRVFTVLDTLFKKFITLRVTDEWHTVLLPAMRKWISDPLK